MSRYSAGGQREKSTVPQFRQRKERTEVLCGWKTPTVDDETDIIQWAKKRQLQDGKENNKQTPLKWDKYLCTVIKKCRALESVQVFIDGSLSVSLKPTPSHLEREPTKVKLKHSSSMPIMKIPEEVVEGVKKNKPEQGGIIKEEEEAEDATKSSKAEGQKESEAKPSGSSKEGPNQHDITVNGINEDNNSSGENTQVSTTEENVPLCQQDGTAVVSVEDADTLTERSETTPSSGGMQSDSRTKLQEKPAPKFSYTRSNITLNVHPSFLPMSNGNKQFKGEDIRAESDNEYENSEEVTAEFETVKKLTFKDSMTNPLKRTSNERRVLHTTNLTHSSILPNYISKRALLPGHGSLSSKSESTISRMPQQDSRQVMAVTQVLPNSSQAFDGMSIASLKSAKRVQSAITDTVGDRGGGTEDGQQDKKMSQKQVMLVLKKVTLKDDLGELYKEDRQENPFQQTHALLTSHNQKYDLPTSTTTTMAHNNHSKKSKQASQIEQSSGTPKSRQKAICFPIGDLLPAVDTSIRNSMPARHYRSMEHPGLERESGEGGKENMLSYEDGMSMMKQGIEIFRVKSNVLGPPAFRPQNGKTPLQRAKENVSKRAYTNLPLSATQVAEVTDFSRTLWKSSAGSLYSNPVVRSRPGSRNEDEARTTRSSRLSKKWKTDYENTTEVSAATELQQVSKTLSSRLNQLARQRGSEEQEMFGRESVR